MKNTGLGEMETRFADMIWETAPVSSGTLVALCAKSLGWKKSTTYTMLKRLCDKGLFVNNSGTVEVLLTKAKFEALQSESFVERIFEGSLPRFLTAFTTQKKLADSEIDEIVQMITEYRDRDKGSDEGNFDE